MKVSLIIPAFNEAEGVAQTAKVVRAVIADMRKLHDVEVVFVNDGSRDNTAQLLQQEFANEPGVQVVSHEANRGLGAAIRTGFSHATGEIMITTDFDGTYAFETIPKLLEQLIADGTDLVTASPYHPKGKVEGVPRYRLLFSFGASLLYRLLVNWHIHTWTALFRAYRATMVRAIPFESNDFLAGTELIVNALRAGYKVSEFPATLRVRTFGQSSLKIARVTRAHLRFQLKILWARLSGNSTARIVPVGR